MLARTDAISSYLLSSDVHPRDPEFTNALESGILSQRSPGILRGTADLSPPLDATPQKTAARNPGSRDGRSLTPSRNAPES
jgi:hypothetical protein